MNTKLIKLNDELKKYQSDLINSKKNLIALNNDLTSKEEFYKNQQTKYNSMKLELTQREVQLKELQNEVDRYSKMNIKDLNSNSYNAMIEKYLDELNVKKEFVQLLQTENKRVDQKYTIESRSLQDQDQAEEEQPPEKEFYAGSTKEVVTIKYVRSGEMKRIASPGREENILKSTTITSFRIDKDTTFTELKEIACKFWKVPLKEFDLTDENGAQLPEEAKIILYFRNHSQNIDTILLYLKYKQITKNLTQGMLEVITARDQQTIAKIDSSNFQRLKKVEINGYREFFKEFPGEKDYIDEDKLNEKPNLNQKKRTWKPKTRIMNDEHCCLALWFFILILINIISIAGQINPTQIYKAINSFGTMLRIENQIVNFDNSYQGMNTITEFFVYLDEAIASNLFRSETENSALTAMGFPLIYAHNTFIGPFRLRQVKTKVNDDCILIPGSSQTVGCYYVDYNEDTRETADLGTGVNSWEKFHTAEENLIESIVQGYSSNYDGSGYVLDLNTSITNTSQAKDLFQELHVSSAIDFGTRAVIVTANLYNHGTDTFIEIELGAEFTAAGLVRPFEKRINFYKTNRYAADNYTMGTDLFKLLFAILITAFLLYMTFTDEKGRLAFNWKYYQTFPAIINPLIIALIYFSVHNNLKLRDYGNNIQGLMREDRFFDGKRCSDLYNVNYVVDGFVVFLLAFRLTCFLKVSDTFSKIINTMLHAGIMLTKYIIILILMLFSFALMGMVLWGAITPNFEIEVNALISVASLPLGHFDYDIIEHGDIHVTAAYLTIYYFFFIFFLTTVFASILIDSYRIITMEHNAKKNEEEKKNFKLFFWLFSWFPFGLASRFVRWTKDLKNKKQLQNKEKHSTSKSKITL